jgi:hypothetical protein
MSTPNLPVRYEIENFGSSEVSTLEHICASVQSEGGVEPIGLTRAVDRTITPLSCSASADINPLISVRLNSNFQATVVYPNDFAVLNTSNADFRWALYLNPSVTGSDNASWTTVSGSSIEYDINRNSTNYLSGGVMIRSGYVPGGQNAKASNAFADALESGFFIGFDVDGNSDELVLAVQVLEDGVANFYGSFGWRELT